MHPADDAPVAPNVLVVDDDPQLCEMVQRALGRASYSVHCVARGADGLRWLEAQEPDLLLLDLMLPDVSGLDLCHQVREQTREVYLPIIMLTGVLDPERRRECFAAGADDYITKPFAIGDLLDRVRAWTGARQRIRAAHTRALREQARVRQLDEQIAQDEAVLAMARTMSHRLNQPLTILTSLLDLQKAGAYPGGASEQFWAELNAAAQDLIGRVQELGRVVRYAPRDEAGFRLVDLSPSQPREP